MSLLRLAPMLLACLALSSLPACKKSEGSGGADVAGMDKGSKTTKLGKTLGNLTKDDLVAGLKKAGFANPTNSTSTSPGVNTYAAYGKKGDVGVSLVLSAWENPKTRASMVASRKKDPNVAVFEDGDFYIVMEAKEKDKPSAAKSKALLAEVVGP
jgi:hypothetical protein